MKPIYSQTDKALAALSKVTSAEFMRLSRARFDELNVISVRQTVALMFERLLLNNRTAYLGIALAAYAAGLVISKDAGSLPNKRTSLDDAWIDAELGEYNPVTGYLYYSEADRKRMRLVEQILTAAEYKSRKMLDDGIKQSANAWWRQTAQYAVDITDAAALAAYADCGITHVMWVSEQDERVCRVCEGRDGQIYPMDDIPAKPHYNCRCYLVPLGWKGGGA